ncbi:MAG: ATP synthase F1 subunit epsilon [bacterium]|nr:ATP synthase F1 subunit epsilon [bacterium]
MGFQLTIVTPQRPVLDREVETVVVPGQEGDFGVLASHEPFLAPIEGGVLCYTADGRTTEVEIGGGFAEVGHDRVIVLAQSADGAEIGSEKA